MSDNVKTLDTGYSPKIVDPSGIKLPIELKNGRGEVIASICSDYKTTDRYVAYINHHRIDCYGFGFSDITECIEAAFAYIYQQMQEYRKQAEEYNEVRTALRKALK